ncbi:hypothetical protein F0562_012994 [Nyssa sinensis]|uniref:Uncharacterized protein n=1 Tax=Nyssa sinensis TaxID=561372 RepID=A0A5J4ZXU9_9ASTE|nr:hypothetical protein F0562_012994 [Nyssa sinensis]
MAPRGRGRPPAAAPVNITANAREEINQLRRQVELLTQRLAQVESLTHDEEEFESEDTFDNPFHGRDQLLKVNKVSKLFKVEDVMLISKVPNQGPHELQLQLVGVRRGKKLMFGSEEPEQSADYEAEPVFDDDDDDEDLVYGDVGESLVIQKNLLLPKEEVKEDWLRNNLFHTTCTIEGKVCKLIIDSGNCENVVSRAAVEKLKLKKEEHPKPY